jgi:hypothetical protein
LRSSIIAFRQTLLRWIARYKKRLNGKKRRQVDSPRSGHSVGEVETDASPGIVEATIDEEGPLDVIGIKAEEDEEPTDWEIAIANSLSGTLEFVV